MTFLELVRRVQDALGERQAAAALTAAAGSVDEKFSNFALRAVRQGAIWTDWPWDLVDTAVTATAVPSRFTLDPTLRRLTNVVFNGVPVNTQFTYNDLRLMLGPTLDAAVTGIPIYAALYDQSTLLLHPPPATGDIPLVSVRGYRVPVVPTADTDALVGPVEYHDALARLAQAYAVREYLGNIEEAKTDLMEAERMLRAVAVAYRKSPARPRWRY